MAKRSLKNSMAAALDIPEEVALDSAKIIITGQRRVDVENQKGIIEYLPGKIVFKTAGGQAEVLGEGLTLSALSAGSLSIDGEIMAVCLTREGSDNG